MEAVAFELLSVSLALALALVVIAFASCVLLRRAAYVSRREGGDKYTKRKRDADTRIVRRWFSFSPFPYCDFFLLGFFFVVDCEKVEGRKHHVKRRHRSRAPRRYSQTMRKRAEEFRWNS